MTSTVVPEIEKTFAIPELLLRRIPEKAYPPREERASIIALDIKIDAVVFRFADADRASKAWAGFVLEFGQHGLDVGAVHGAPTDGFGYTGPVLVLKEPSVNQIYVGKDDANWQTHNHRLIQTDLEAFRKFARLTGYRVRYYLGSGVPHPHEDGVLNFYSSLVRPPGLPLKDRQAYSTLFGLHLWVGDGTRWVLSPTSWRGRVLAAEGVPVFQILGNNVYQFPLFIGDECNTFNRAAVWESLLALLAADLAGCHEGGFGRLDGDDFEKCVREMVCARSEGLREGLKEIDDEIEVLQRKLTEKLRDRLTQATSLKALESEAVELSERTRADFERIRARPDIVAIHANAEDGLMIETVPIALERGGRRYDLGPFRVHIAAHGEVAIWSEVPKHPDGHHHPHIDKASLECFGNITLAVAKLATSYRFAETIEIVMRWLRSYRPELTIIPLEGFPSEPIAETPVISKGVRREKELELLGPAQADRSVGRPSGDADRRRSGRKPRRARARQDGSAEARRLGRR